MTVNLRERGSSMDKIFCLQSESSHSVILVINNHYVSTEIFKLATVNCNRAPKTKVNSTYP